MALKSIPDPGFPHDDGTADPRLAAALARYRDNLTAEPEVLAALAEARLLVPVVAVLGEAEAEVGVPTPKAEGGLLREKTSEMAVPTIQARGGRRALPAFTSVGALSQWRPDARPVAVTCRQALLAAAQERAGTLLIDLAGPVTFQLTGAAMRALAEGRQPVAADSDPEVAEAVRSAVSGEPSVLRAYLFPGKDTDATVGLVVEPGVPVREVAGRIAAALCGDEVLRSRLGRGLDLALLPAGSALPAEPVFTR